MFESTERGGYWKKHYVETSANVPFSKALNHQFPPQWSCRIAVCYVMQGKSKIYAQSADSLIMTGGKKKSLVLFPAACIMTVLTREHTQKPESPFNDCAHINEAL